jgi:tetratricopeptide (TPR) repeat protein
MTKTGAQGVYTMMYYNHNVHFFASANAMKGRYADAIKAARELEAGVKPHVAAMPMLEMFVPYPIVTMVRFGKWEEILATPKPEGSLKITTAYWHFARGMAYSVAKETTNAETELKAFQALAKEIPANGPFGNNVVGDVLRVAESLLQATLTFFKGDKKSAIDLFTKAVEAEDALHYNEPADWDLPVREYLGVVLLASGEKAEAEKVFRAEIAKHQRNGRALHGLALSLRLQGKDTAAEMVQREFEQAWATADTPLTFVKAEAVKSKSNNDE